MSKPQPIPYGPEGKSWPSGYCEVAALIAVEDAWVAQVFGHPLISGVEDGVGEWVGSGGKLRSGAMVELVRYEFEKHQQFQLRFDGKANIQATLAEFMEATGLPADSICWRNPAILP
jgi:hypothetical protein